MHSPDAGRTISATSGLFLNGGERFKRTGLIGHNLLAVRARVDHFNAGVDTGHFVQDVLRVNGVAHIGDQLQMVEGGTIGERQRVACNERREFDEAL